MTKYTFFFCYLLENLEPDYKTGRSFFSYFSSAVRASRTKASAYASFQGYSPNHQNSLQCDLREAQNINI